MSRERLFFFAALGIFVPLAGAGSYLLWFSAPSFAEAISECNETATQLRFSCYRSVLEEHYDASSLEDYVRSIEGDRSVSFESKDNSYAVFGANCHTFYHALGDFAAVHGKGELRDLLYMGPTKCTGGYLMGLYKRRALQEGYPTELLKEFYAISRPEERIQAAHEIGHALHDKYTTAVLGVVDDVSRREYGMKFPQEYQYTTFPDARPDLTAPFRECDEIIPAEDGSMRVQCRTGIGHNMFVFSEFDPEGYKNQFAQCELAQSENREDCYKFLIYRIGINEGATRFLSYDYDAGNRVCQEATNLGGSEEFKKDCYIGIGGGLGLFLDSEYPYDTITEENLAGVKQRTKEVAELCLSSEEGYGDTCFAGLLGTKFKNFYESLNIYQEDIERLLPQLQEGLEVVG